MITVLTSTGLSTGGQTLLPLGFRLADGLPVGFGKVERKHMAVFTRTAPPHVQRVLADQILVDEQRVKHVTGVGPTRSVSQIPIRYSEGVRLEGDQPGKLSLVTANGDAEHVVFATITGETDTRLNVYKSHSDLCRVFHCAVDGTPDAPSAVIMAVGFNCKHLDNLAVVVKICEARKSLVEVRVITPSGIYQGLISEEVFEMFLNKDHTIDVPLLMRTAGIKKKMSWSAAV